MKRRIISEKNWKKAYRGELSEDRNYENLGSDWAERMDRLPDEVFGLIGELIGFIESAERKEEEKE